jgi:hypothetical protein
MFTNGQRANNQYALADRVGQIVKRTDQAARRAAASTSRKASPIAKSLVTQHYSIRPGKLTDKVKTRIDGQTLHVDASVRRFPLIDFAGKWGGRRTEGATASIMSGETVTYRGAFIAVVRGLKSIRMRKTRGGKRVPRGPLQILRGRSMYQMITGIVADQNGNVTGRVDFGIQDALKSRLIDYYVSEIKRLYRVAAGDNRRG